jgi:hypothetical protein
MGHQYDGVGLMSRNQTHQGGADTLAHLLQRFPSWWSDVQRLCLPG